MVSSELVDVLEAKWEHICRNLTAEQRHDFLSAGSSIVGRMTSDVASVEKGLKELLALLARFEVTRDLAIPARPSRVLVRGPGGSTRPAQDELSELVRNKLARLFVGHAPGSQAGAPADRRQGR